MKNKIECFVPKVIFAMILTCLISSLFVEIPKIFNVNEKSFFFYQKNLALILFFGLSLFSLWTAHEVSYKKAGWFMLFFLIPAVYVNLLPSVCNSSSIDLVYIHLPILLWSFYGIVYLDFDLSNKPGRMNFIKYNGDLAMVTGLILICGMFLTAVSVQLFQVLHMNIEKFCSNYLLFPGLVSAPVVAAFIISAFPTASGKIVPIIARIFSPLVLFMLVIYLIAIPFSGNDLYNDRDFLLVFNIMLLVVMAVVVFSLSESITGKRSRFNESVLMLLTFVTFIIDLVALSAIFYRLGEFGISPNRIAVLGSNILIFINISFILVNLFKVNFKKADVSIIGNTISRYIPVYLVWILIVIFAFPFLFGMK